MCPMNRSVDWDSNAAERLGLSVARPRTGPR
jgi:hypothetical protein